jgi:hypothetical protein
MDANEREWGLGYPQIAPIHADGGGKNYELLIKNHELGG